MARYSTLLCVLLLAFVAVTNVSGKDECRECSVAEQCCRCNSQSCKNPNSQNDKKCDSAQSLFRSVCDNVDCIDECSTSPSAPGPETSLKCCVEKVEKSCLRPRPDAEECGGTEAGKCLENGRCECNDGFRPPACFNVSAFKEANEARKDQFKDLADKLKGYREERASRCNDSFPVLCRSDADDDGTSNDDDDVSVPAEFRGTCQERLIDCFGGNATLYKQIKDEKKNKCASASEQFCDIDGCIARNIPCSAVSQECPRNKPHRCADWSCAKDKDQCKDDKPCQGNRVLCADGVTCAKDDEECAEMGIQWEGCPGERLECAGFRGLCARNISMCEMLGACPEGKSWCGIRRNGQGKVVFDAATGKPQPICKNKCDFERPTPEPKAGEFKRGTLGRLVAMSQSGVVALVLETTVAEAFLRADNETGGVNFTIGPVSDSLVQHGPFRKYFNGGTMMSQPVLVEPSAEVIIPGDGFLLEFPIFDDAITNESMCLRALASLSVVTVQDITKFDAEVELVSPCSRGALPNCSCAVNLTHFSVYTVVDAEAQASAEEAAAETDADLDAAATTAVATTTAAAGGGAATTAGSDGSAATTAGAVATTAGEQLGATTAAEQSGGTTAQNQAGGTTSTTEAAVATTEAAVATTPAPATGFALQVTSTVAGVSKADFLASLGAFRSAVAALHSGREESDVVVDEATCCTEVDVARRRLLATGVQVDYEVQNFATEAAATAAKAVQEGGAATMTANLKSTFPSISGITQTVAVADDDGNVVTPGSTPADSAAAGRVCSWAWAAAAGVAALAAMHN